MSLNDQLVRARVFDLAQPYYPGAPHYPTHPPFLYGLTKKHGDMVGTGGVSSSADAIALGSHVGTHIDALCHFSCGGKLHGGIDAAGNQDTTHGMQQLGVDTIGPIVRRGVLLDMAAVAGADPLPPPFAITPAHLDAAVARHGVIIRPGNVVLLRTGWGALWHDAVRYVTGHVAGAQVAGPGPEREGAEWLSARGIFAAGSDTIAFERVPSGAMPVHVHLLVECGIHIIEALNLEDLARAGVYEFTFIGAPLKIRGATGAPLRPLAFAEGEA